MEFIGKLLSIWCLSALIVQINANEKYDLSFLKKGERAEVQKYLNSNKYREELDSIIKEHSNFSRSKFNQLLINENREMSKKNLLLISWPDDGQMIYRIGERIIRDMK